MSEFVTGGNDSSVVKWAQRDGCIDESSITVHHPSERQR
jgi:hypothetical protein